MLDLLLTIVQWLLVLCFPLLMAYGAVCDFRTLQIPNWISIAAATLYLPAALLLGIGFKAIAIHYGVGLFVFALGAALFMYGFIGGGDVKLLASAAIWTGWEGLPVYLLLLTLIGGLLSLAAVLLRRMKRLPVSLASLPWLHPESDGHIPYGVAIGGAAVLVFNRLAVLP